MNLTKNLHSFFLKKISCKSLCRHTSPSYTMFFPSSIDPLLNGKYSRKSFTYEIECSVRLSSQCAPTLRGISMILEICTIIHNRSIQQDGSTSVKCDSCD